VSFIDRLDHELAARRVAPARRRRILLEYADHIRSDPSCEDRLGDPGELAQTFAAELAADDVRRTTGETFLALSLAAVALVVGQLLIAPGGGYPGFNNGISIAISIPALLMLLVAPQVALVSGMLAVLRAARRWRPRRLPDAEVALIYRRCAVAGAAGLVTCAGLLLYVVNFVGRMAPWWLVTQGLLAAIAGACLVVVAVRAHRAQRTIGDVVGSAGGIVDDIPPLRPIAAHPVRWIALAAVAGLVGGSALGGVAERSLIEGLERGTFEGLVVAGGLTLALGTTVRRRSAAAQRRSSSRFH
jgi:hypothetical protein